MEANNKSVPLPPRPKTVVAYRLQYNTVVFSGVEIKTDRMADFDDYGRYGRYDYYLLQ